MSTIAYIRPDKYFDAAQEQLQLINAYAVSKNIVIDDEFIDWFSIAGPPQKCIDRLGELIELGLDYVYLLGGSPVAEPRDARLKAMVKQTEIFANEVLPTFK